MDAETVFLALFAAVIGFFVYQLIRYRGWRGALFGAQLEGTLGEVRGIRRGPMWSRLKIHALAGRGSRGPLVGLELVARTPLSWQMMPIILSLEETQRLIVLLEQARARQAQASQQTATR